MTPPFNQDIAGHVGALTLRLISLALAVLAGAYLNRASQDYSQKWDFTRGLVFFLIAVYLMILAYVLTIKHFMPHIY